VFKNDLGEISKEHPVIEIYKKKFLIKKTSDQELQSEKHRKT
jgi:hypothetical protein